jgi:hypothetical protein
MRDMLILNEIQAQHKTYIFKRFAWITYYHLVSAHSPNYKRQILLSVRLRKVCYSLPEIYVKSVYLIVILAEGVMKSMKHLNRGASYESLGTSDLTAVSSRRVCSSVFKAC